MLSKAEQDYNKILEYLSAGRLPTSEVIHLVKKVAALGWVVEDIGRRRAIGAWVESGNKIQAIKAYRKVTGEGLRESKDVVEDFITKLDSIGIGRAK